MTKQLSVRIDDDIYKALKEGGYNQTDLINSLLQNFFEHDVVVSPPKDDKFSIIDEIRNILLGSGINKSLWVQQGRTFNDSQVRLISVRLKERGHLISEKRVVEVLENFTW